MSSEAGPAGARMRVLVTGAGGFIGARVAAALERRGDDVTRMLRDGDGNSDGGAGPGVVRADLADRDALAWACADVDCVVHCAGHAHAFESGTEDQRLQHEVNFVGTRNLGEAAAAVGVRHLVFLSSVKAMGAPDDECVNEDWPLPPETPYGRAKRAAEDALDAIAADSALSVTHLRLAMVYGHGSRGNLERMLAGIRAGWFPPLPETGRRRSLVHVDDVVSAVLAALGDERAFGRAYVVADSGYYSAAHIYDLARELLGLGRVRWRVPAFALRAAGRLGDLAAPFVRRPLPMNSASVSRLLDAECFSADRIHADLGWASSVSLADGLRETLFGTDVTRSVDRTAQE